MLRIRDYETASRFLAALYELRDLEEFPAFLVRELPGLIGAEQVVWNELAPSVPASRLIAYPALDEPDEIQRRFAAHMLSHPCIRHVLQTGDTRAIKISDFLSPAQYHATPVYQRVHRSFGVEDQLGIALTPPAGETRAVAIGRDRRSFTQRDRALLDYLRPHLARSHENLRILGRARRAASQRDALIAELGLSLITLDADGRALDCPPKAVCWLKDYFTDSKRECNGGLPTMLRRWLRTAAASLKAGTPEGPPTLTKRRGGRCLTARLVRERHGFLIVLEERTTRDHAMRLAVGGLGRRELEVLLELEKGKTNVEIAATLYVSPRTVGKHLERIYRKLGVTNRTEAVVRLRGDEPRR